VIGKLLDFCVKVGLIMFFELLFGAIRIQLQ